MTNPNAPAFPMLGNVKTGHQTEYFKAEGLTKREYFAALAMQGMCSNQRTNKDNLSHLPRLAIETADALIKALGETK